MTLPGWLECHTDGRERAMKRCPATQGVPRRRDRRLTSFCYPGASERQTSARPSRLTVKPYSSRQPSARMAHVQSLVVVPYLAVAVIKVVKRSLRAQTANITQRRQNYGKTRMPIRLIY